MTVQLDWAAWNAKRKSMGKRFAKNAGAPVRAYTGAVKKGQGVAKRIGGKMASNAASPFKAYYKGVKKGQGVVKSVGSRIARNAGAPVRAYVGAVKKGQGVAKKAFGKVKRFENLDPTIALENGPEELYDTLASLLVYGEEGEKAYFDAEEFDLAEIGLPKTEDGFYEIDADTAAAILDTMDEMAVEAGFDEDEIPEEEMEDEVLDEEIDEMDEAQLELHSRVIALEQQLAVKEVDAAIAEARAYRDERGFGHAAITLEIFEALMKGEIVNDTITLEDASDPASVGAYIREGLLFALKTIPGQQPFESRTIGGEVKKLEAGDASKFDDGRKVAKTFWSQL